MHPPAMATTSRPSPFLSSPSGIDGFYGRWAGQAVVSLPGGLWSGAHWGPPSDEEPGARPAGQLDAPAEGFGPLPHVAQPSPVRWWAGGAGTVVGHPQHDVARDPEVYGGGGGVGVKGYVRQRFSQGGEEVLGNDFGGCGVDRSAEAQRGVIAEAVGGVGNEVEDPGAQAAAESRCAGARERRQWSGRRRWRSRAGRRRRRDGGRRGGPRRAQ